MLFELWEWFKVFSAVCMILGLSWIGLVSIHERLRAAGDPDAIQEYERDRL